MTIKEFYKEYNLNKYEFAEIAGVGVKSLIKFEHGEPIRKSTEDRIRKAMHVADIYMIWFDHDLIIQEVLIGMLIPTDGNIQSKSMITRNTLKN